MSFIPGLVKVRLAIDGMLDEYLNKFVELKKEELKLKRTAEMTKAFLRNAHGNQQPAAFVKFKSIWDHFEKLNEDE